AISAAAHDVLVALYTPADQAAIDAKLSDAQNADLDSGTQFQSDVDAGLSIGHAVAALALARKATDLGDAAQPAYVIDPTPGHWSPGPGEPATDPVLDNWGAVETWLLPDGQAVRPPPPPTFAGADWITF